MNVAVIGYSGNTDESPIKELKALCLTLGKWIAEKKHNLWTGGRDGIMELVSRGAFLQGGEVYGVLPFDEKEEIVKPCPYLKHAIYTGLDFQMRSFILLKNADIVISIGGATGTAIEIFGAYTYRKPLVLLASTGGYTQKVAEWFKDQEPPFYLDHRKSAPLYVEYSLESIQKYL